MVFYPRVEATLPFWEEEIFLITRDDEQHHFTLMTTYCDSQFNFKRFSFFLTNFQLQFSCNYLDKSFFLPPPCILGEIIYYGQYPFKLPSISN